MAGILALAKYGVLVGVLSIGALLPSAKVEPTAKVRVGAQSGLVVSAAGSIWTTDFALGRVVRVDPAKNSVTKRIALPGRPFGMAYGAGSVWVADRSANVLARINPRTNRVVKRISSASAPTASASEPAASGRRARRTALSGGSTRRRTASSPRSRWGRRRTASSTPSARSGSRTSARGTVVRIDPKTNRVTKRVAVAKADWITPSADALWVSTRRGRSCASIQRSGRREDRRRRESARVGMGRRGAVGAEPGRWHDLGDRSGKERDPGYSRGGEVGDCRLRRRRATPGSPTRTTGSFGAWIQRGRNELSS